LRWNDGRWGRLRMHQAAGGAKHSQRKWGWRRRQPHFSWSASRAGEGVGAFRERGSDRSLSAPIGPLGSRFRLAASPGSLTGFPPKSRDFAGSPVRVPHKALLPREVPFVLPSRRWEPPDGRGKWVRLAPRASSSTCPFRRRALLHPCGQRPLPRRPPPQVPSVSGGPLIGREPPF